MNHSPLPSNLNREINYPEILLDNTLKIGDHQNRLNANTQSAFSFPQQSAFISKGVCAEAARYRNLPFASEVIAANDNIAKPINNNISTFGHEIEPIFIPSGRQAQPIIDNTLVSRVYGVQHQSNLNWSAPAYLPPDTCAMNFIASSVFPSNFAPVPQDNFPCGTQIRADPANYACVAQMRSQYVTDNNPSSRNQKLYPTWPAQQTQWQAIFQQPPCVLTPFWGEMFRHPSLPVVQTQVPMPGQQLSATFRGSFGHPGNYGNIEWSNKT